jgi:hypothetical protein
MLPLVVAGVTPCKLLRDIEAGAIGRQRPFRIALGPQNVGIVS